MAMQSGFIKRIRDIMRMDAGINGDAQRIEQMVWMLFLKVYDAKEDDWELNEDNYISIIPDECRWRNWAQADDNGIYPMVTENGIKVMSINLLLPTEETPVIWRGPVLANMVKQFWTDVIWDQIDYLFVDMPPGTGDVPLTVFQSLPVDGIVIVSSPQDLVRMIVRKAYNMAEMMKIPVLGIVENYSFVKCPDCGTEIKVFGESHIDEIAEELNVPVLGKMPIDVSFAAKADSGAFAQIDNQYIKAAVEVMPE